MQRRNAIFEALTDSICSGVEDGVVAAYWTTKDAEWRQITFHSLVSRCVLPEFDLDPDRSLLLLSASHYLSHVKGGRDYGIYPDLVRFTRNELLQEFVIPVEITKGQPRFPRKEMTKLNKNIN